MIKLLAAVACIAVMCAGCTSSSYMTTKDNVMALTKQGVSDNVIIEKIRATHSTYRVSNENITTLKDSGVRDTVISVMLKRTDNRYVRTYYSHFYWDPFWYGPPWYYGPYYRSYIVYPYTPYHGGFRTRR